MTAKRLLMWSTVSVLALILGIPLGWGQRVTAASTASRSEAANVVPVSIERYHPAVGTWMGIAVQVCPSGVAPAACSPFGPAVSLLMTPTLEVDGNFVAHDTLELMGPPFGPHTGGHGKWVATSATEIIADYIFIVSAVPPDLRTPSFNGFRARWVAQTVGNDDIVGWVNGYLIPGVPATWQSMTAENFPSYPAEALPLVTSPKNFYKDPSECQGQGCPLVFKFHCKRVTP